MTANNIFIFDCESNICTNRMAIKTGAINIATVVIASLLSAAANPAKIALIMNIHKPISMPVIRYRNFLLQTLQTNQIKKAINKAVDMYKL